MKWGMVGNNRWESKAGRVEGWFTESGGPMFDAWPRRRVAMTFGSLKEAKRYVEGRRQDGPPPKHRQMAEAYHATTIEGASAILASGVFKRGSYFAFDVNDALRFAGPVVFKGEFETARFKGEPDGWQFWLREDLPLASLCSSRHWSDPRTVEGEDG